MENTYHSVTQFYVDLRAHFVGAGLPVVRTVGATDLVHDAGTGFFRFKLVSVSPTVSAIGWAFGVDADALAVASWDVERQMPFTITPDGEFAPTFHWYAPTKTFSFNITPPTVGPGYRIDVCIDTQTSQILHRNRFNPQFEPNAKDTGGPYISAGA